MPASKRARREEVGAGADAAADLLAMFAGAGGLATLAVLLGSLSGWVVRAAAYALRQYVFDPQLTLLVDLDDAVRSQP